MYNEQLASLIEMALMDGELTEKERNVLFRKAQEFGVDLDEFEMVLDAKLVEKQKQGALSVGKDNIIKCPSCNDIIPALSRICPSCDYVLSSRNSSGSEKGLEDLINDIEENLVEIKSIPRRNIFSSLIHHSYISFSLLTLIVFLVGFRLGEGFLLLIAVGMIVLSVKLIRKKLKSTSEDWESSTLYENQKALFEKHSRTANTLFGENKRVRLLLNELKDELSKIDQERIKNKKVEIITYVVIGLISIGAFFIPSDKSVYEVEKDNKEADRELILKAEELIEINKMDEVVLIIPKLKSDESIVLVKSKIQLSELSEKLTAIELLLKGKKYQEVNFELSKLVWQKISRDYETERLERDVFKTFLQKKGAINNQLPEKYKIEIESELDLL